LKEQLSLPVDNHLVLLPDNIPLDNGSDLSLGELGLKDGSRLAVRASTDAVVVVVKFRVVVGNDRSTKPNPHRPGVKGPLLVAEIDRAATVKEAKKLFCQLAGVPLGSTMEEEEQVGDVHRVRINHDEWS